MNTNLKKDRCYFKIGDFFFHIGKLHMIDLNIMGTTLNVHYSNFRNLECGSKFRHDGRQSKIIMVISGCFQRLIVFFLKVF